MDKDFPTNSYYQLDQAEVLYVRPKLTVCIKHRQDIKERLLTETNICMSVAQKNSEMYMIWYTTELSHEKEDCLAFR